MSRGFLSVEIKSEADFKENDFRKYLPKFMGEQFQKNIELLNEIEKMAAEKNITTSQLAIAWVIAKGALPIPGTKRIKYIEQNIAATEVVLSEEEMNRLEAIIPLGTDTGDRYDAGSMAQVDK